MRPVFEQVLPDHGASWTFEERRLAEGIPFEWHYHPEYELTLTLHSRGYRSVGTDNMPYGAEDLVLLGPGVPHSWCSTEPAEPGRPHVVFVIKFSEFWLNRLGELLPEFAQVRRLLRAARGGISFGPESRAALRPIIEAMPAAAPPQRLMLLFSALVALGAARDMTLLSTQPNPATLAVPPDPRLTRVLEHIHTHYAAPAKMVELAQLACVSVSALHRLFKRHTRMAMTEYLSRLRLGHACALLIQGHQPINVIAGECGYHNLALFNRQFRALKSCTPSAFRKAFRTAAAGPSGPAVAPLSPPSA